MRALLIWLITFMVAVPVAQAQDGPRAPVGWSGQIEGFALWQGESALSNGGDFAINRGVLRGGAFYRWASGTSAGLQLSLGGLTIGSATPLRNPGTTSPTCR